MASKQPMQTFCPRCNQPFTFDFSTNSVECVRCGIRGGSATSTPPPAAALPSHRKRERDELRAKPRPIAPVVAAGARGRNDAMMVQVQGKDPMKPDRIRVEPVHAAMQLIAAKPNDQLVINRAGLLTHDQRRSILRAHAGHLIQGSLILIIWAAVSALAMSSQHIMWACLLALPVAAALFPLVFRPLHEIFVGRPAVVEGEIKSREVMTTGGRFAHLAIVQGIELRVEPEQMTDLPPRRRYRVYYAPVAHMLLSAEPI